MLGTDGKTRMAEDAILSAEEVAQELRCSKAHVYNVIRGKVDGVSPLPVLTMGRRCLIRRSTLDTWMEQNESVADLQRPNEPCSE